MSMDRMWSMVYSIPMQQTAMIKTMDLQYQAYRMLRPMGEALPLALEAGEKPIEPMVFETAGEAIERMAGKLVTTTV